MILTDGPGYRIVVDEDQLDLLRFDKALDEARRHATVDGEVAALEAALALYRGRVLPDSRSPVLTSAAAALEDRYLGARERLLELRLEQGRAHDAVSELMPLVAEHPLRESLSALLMVALYRVGRQADALRVYHDLRNLLAEQLGIDPSSAVNYRYQQILRNEPGLDTPPAARRDRPAAPPAPAPPPRSLPHDLPDFTGREAELEQLLAHVPPAPGDPADAPAPHQAVRIITVDGMAGSGKTALAVHAAHRVADRYPDGQVFLDLHGFSPHCEPVEPRDALGTLLRAVGVPADLIPDDPADRESLWRGTTADRRMLLLFDNVVASDQVRPLIPAGPGCLVLVTSRPRLAGLDGAVPLPLPLPSPADGLALLSQVLSHRRVAAEQEAAAELVALCGRLPLALRIVASRLTNRPHWSLAYLAGRLREESLRLDELTVEHRSVRSALHLSYAVVSPRHQELFRLLGAHPGTDFDRYAVAALAGLTPHAAEALLEDLLDARLLVQHTPGRYTFHSLVRALAREAAAHQPHTTRDTQQRLLDHYLRVADEAAGLLGPHRERPHHERPARERPRPADPPHAPAAVPPLRDAADALGWFEAERANLLAALAHAEAVGLDSHVARLPLALAPYLHTSGHIEDELGVLRKAAAAARRLGDPALEGAALTGMAAPYGHLGRVKEGLECAREALSLAERAGDRVGAAFCLGRIGAFHNALGQYENAIAALHRALVQLSRSDAHDEESAVLVSLGEAQAALGRHAEALQTSRLVVLQSRQSGDAYGELTGLLGEATAYAGAGQLDTALDRLAEASELARHTTTPDGQAPILAQYADVYRRQGRHREALHAGHAALQLLRRVRRPALTAAVHNVIGAVHRDRGDYERGEGHHQQARRLAQQAGLRRELALALDGIAHARAHGEDPHEAKEHEPRAEAFLARSASEAR
ncbi:BTAD domain-containing putative transcriptional regulator [Streptomyces sp. TRM76323]|uniref:BTAD domain-containing putative transcriptional regulator n=1 Tax=Streptomyces tamarix TaxID=3078565 RepID=A0ABU3QRX1_9ACTN|nr:BTAD domain-containing putative transcriptional regulator [Streptomyces tamarix]MDT9685288.1 BTAD domain-containing putative transcriptional regulator [Streptomyces tamarix]